MPCYSPRKAGFERNPTSNGKYKLTFSPKNYNKELAPIDIPCGKCIGCRIDKSISWAIRMTKESESHDQNCFITLTYSPEHLPDNSSLIKTDLQKFIKRLRKKTGKKILYYAVGEYGDKTLRPHYHLCLFGFKFSDMDKKYPIKNHDTNSSVYSSPSLSKLWGLGHCTVGNFTFRTAAYCARYVTKKIYGEKAQEHYKDRIPEFALMSLKPAIGLTWLENNLREIEDGKISCNNKTLSLPRYYNLKLNKINPKFHIDNITNRHIISNSDANRAERAPERLKELKQIFLLKAKNVLLKGKI